jgi:hypothetical protein
MTSNNILPTFQDGDKYLECILKNGEHDYESLDSRQQISKNIIEVHVICLDCGHENYVYNYLEDSEINWLIIIIRKKMIIKVIKEGKWWKLVVILLYYLFNHFRRMNSSKLVAIKPIPAGDSSSFVIHDNSSEIAKFIPEKYVEPLVIVARIQGFDGIDDYIIHLIKDQLEMFVTDTCSRDNLDVSFQKYMHDMIGDKKDVPNT